MAAEVLVFDNVVKAKSEHGCGSRRERTAYSLMAVVQSSVWAFLAVLERNVRKRPRRMVHTVAELPGDGMEQWMELEEGVVAAVAVHAAGKLP